MIERDEVYQDEILLHKKYDSYEPKIKKADHKHTYEDCLCEVYERNAHYDPVKGFLDGTRLTFASFCTVCGKLRWETNKNWAKKVETKRYISYDWTDEAKREFDSETRTIPFFRIKDFFKDKYVKLDESDG